MKYFFAIAHKETGAFLQDQYRLPIYSQKHTADRLSIGLSEFTVVPISQHDLTQLVMKKLKLQPVQNLTRNQKRIMRMSNGYTMAKKCMKPQTWAGHKDTHKPYRAIEITRICKHATKVILRYGLIGTDLLAHVKNYLVEGTDTGEGVFFRINTITPLALEEMDLLQAFARHVGAKPAELAKTILDNK